MGFRFSREKEKKNNGGERVVLIIISLLLERVVELIVYIKKGEEGEKIRRAREKKLE